MYIKREIKKKKQLRFISKGSSDLIIFAQFAFDQFHSYKDFENIFPIEIFSGDFLMNKTTVNYVNMHAK